MLYLMMSNHGLLFLALFCKLAVFSVFLGICYFMSNQYLKEKQAQDPNFIKPKEHSP